MMNVLVVAPHADDEILGAFGVIKKLIADGHKCFWLLVTNMKEEYGYTAKQVSARMDQIRKVKEFVGFEEMFDLGYRPAFLDEYSYGDIVGKLKQYFEKIKPQLVILPYAYDAHSDHGIVFNCALSCTKSFRAPYVKKIMCMDIISETNYASKQFSPNCYIGMSQKTLDDKLKAIGLYESEIQNKPFPRSREAIISQAIFRGSSCYQNYAEAFQIIKEIYE